MRPPLRIKADATSALHRRSTSEFLQAPRTSPKTHGSRPAFPWKAEESCQPSSTPSISRRSDQLELVLPISPVCPGFRHQAVAVRQKLYYRALVPQIIWQLRFPYPTYIESRQIEFIGKTRTRTNWNKRERLQRYKSWRRRWHIQHQKRGTKGKGRNKWQRSEQERKCKQKIMSHHNQYDNVLFHLIQERERGGGGGGRAREKGGERGREREREGLEEDF